MQYALLPTTTYTKLN